MAVILLFVREHSAVGMVLSLVVSGVESGGGILFFWNFLKEKKKKKKVVLPAEVSKEVKFFWKNTTWLVVLIGMVMAITEGDVEMWGWRFFKKPAGPELYFLKSELSFTFFFLFFFRLQDGYYYFFVCEINVTLLLFAPLVLLFFLLFWLWQAWLQANYSIKKGGLIKGLQS